MKRKISDFEASYNDQRALVNEQFFINNNISPQSKKIIMDTIIGNSTLKFCYDNGMLNVGTFYRQTGYYILSDYARKVGQKIKFEPNADQQVYRADQEIEPLITQMFDELRDEQARVKPNADSFAYNQAGLEALNGTSFSLSLELFPDLELESKRNINGTEMLWISRSAGYDLSTFMLTFSPLNFSNTNVPSTSLESFSTFAHEIGHAVDHLKNNDRSKNIVGDVLNKYFGSVTSANYKEVINAIEMAQFSLEYDFLSCYSSQEVFKETSRGSGQYTFNPDASVSVEFVSFFAEMIFVRILRSRDINDFDAKIENYLRDQQKDFETKVEVQRNRSDGNITTSNYSKYFVSDIIFSTSELYRKTLTDTSPDLAKYFIITQRAINEIAGEYLDNIAKEVKDSVDGKDLQKIIDEFLEEKIKEKLRNDPSLLDKDFKDVLEILNDRKFRAELNIEIGQKMVANAKYNHLQDLGRIMGWNDFAKFMNDRVAPLVANNITGSNPSAPDSYLNLSAADVFLETKQHNLIEKSSQIQEDLAKAQSNAIELTNNLKQQQEALDQIRKAIIKDPDNQELKRREADLDKQVKDLVKKAEVANEESENKRKTSEDNAQEMRDNVEESNEMTRDRTEKARHVFEGNK